VRTNVAEIKGAKRGKDRNSQPGIDIESLKSACRNVSWGVRRETKKKRGKKRWAKGEREGRRPNQLIKAVLSGRKQNLRSNAKT